MATEERQLIVSFRTEFSAYRSTPINERLQFGSSLQLIHQAIQGERGFFLQNQAAVTNVGTQHGFLRDVCCFRQCRWNTKRETVAPALDDQFHGYLSYLADGDCRG
ncbi:hypothetical protein RSP799_00610 [Ralstonia solanacearum]|nr:hypothetical protein RSP799_00610 [Ralstonia solanacearum]